MINSIRKIQFSKNMLAKIIYTDVISIDSWYICFSCDKSSYPDYLFEVWFPIAILRFIFNFQYLLFSRTINDWEKYLFYIPTDLYLQLYIKTLLQILFYNDSQFHWLVLLNTKFLFTTKRKKSIFCYLFWTEGNNQ